MTSSIEFETTLKGNLVGHLQSSSQLVLNDIQIVNIRLMMLGVMKLHDFSYQQEVKYCKNDDSK